SAEMCDDGNVNAGDGCSADCRSTETCGNGIVDPIAGEVCDDGNLVAHDGCDNACQPELPHWHPLVAADPGPASNIPFAYDSARGNAMMFDSFATWLWDGHGWVRTQSYTAPSAAYGASSVYDSRRATILLYGGGDLSNNLHETWEWDGAEW